MQLGSDSPGRRRRVFVFVVNGGGFSFKKLTKTKDSSEHFRCEHINSVPIKHFRSKQNKNIKTAKKAIFQDKHSTEVETRDTKRAKMKNQTPSRKVKR